MKLGRDVGLALGKVYEIQGKKVWVYSNGLGSVKFMAEKKEHEPSTIYRDAWSKQPDHLLEGWLDFKTGEVHGHYDEKVVDHVDRDWWWLASTLAKAIFALAIAGAIFLLMLCTAMAGGGRHGGSRVWH